MAAPAPARSRPWATTAAGSTASVPPRGRPHARGHRHPAPLPVRRLRLHRRLGDGPVHQGERRRHPRAGRQGPRGLRPERRRGFLGGRRLLHKAIGDQLHCIFVDNGLLRYDEARQVEETRSARPSASTLHVAHAQDQFLGQPQGRAPTPSRSARSSEGRSSTSSPRRRASSGKVKFLAQGTLYPDVIESSSPIGGPSATIKSHHNVGGLPRRPEVQADRARCASCSRTRSARSAASWESPRYRQPPAVPRARPGRAHPGRGHGRTRRAAAEGRPARAGGDAETAELRATSGSPSPCCFPCRASA